MTGPQRLPRSELLAIERASWYRRCLVHEPLGRDWGEVLGQLAPYLDDDQAWRLAARGDGPVAEILRGFARRWPILPRDWRVATADVRESLSLWRAGGGQRPVLTGAGEAYWEPEFHGRPHGAAEIVVDEDGFAVIRTAPLEIPYDPRTETRSAFENALQAGLRRLAASARAAARSLEAEAGEFEDADYLGNAQRAAEILFQRVIERRTWREIGQRVGVAFSYARRRALATARRIGLDDEALRRL